MPYLWLIPAICLFVEKPCFSECRLVYAVFRTIQLDRNRKTALPRNPICLLPSPPRPCFILFGEERSQSDYLGGRPKEAGQRFGLGPTRFGGGIVVSRLSDDLFEDPPKLA